MSEMRASATVTVLAGLVLTCAVGAGASSVAAAGETRTTEIPGTGLAVTLSTEWRVWSGVTAVIASDVPNQRSCGFDLVDDASSAGEAAEESLETLEAHRQIEVIDRTSLALDAGDAVRVSYRLKSAPDEPRSVLHEYYVTGPEGVARIGCQGIDPPADRWLSIVAALSVSGAGLAASAPFDPRIEMPEHGFAVDFGPEWLVRAWAGPGALLGDIAEDDAGLPRRTITVLRAVTTSTDGKMGEECIVEDDSGTPGLPGADSPMAWQEILIASVAGQSDRTSVPDVTTVDLHLERVVRADWKRWRGMPASAWIFADDERRITLLCRSDDPPADHWRSIAETFEFLSGQVE